MAAKRRPRGPARSKDRYDPKLPNCWYDNGPNRHCSRNGTVYRAHQWWCDRHIPDIPIAENCAHSFHVATPDRMLLCSWCCSIFACLLPKELT